MTTSEQINEIAAALAKAQASMKNAALNKVNPHFRSKYADLAGIRDAITPALAANGIAVVQTLDKDFVLTRLLHTSGQWIESSCELTGAFTDMQKRGSAITYARRYSLSAICGIAADEDDDANVASEQTAAPADAGYDNWLTDLGIVAKEQGYDALVKAINSATDTRRTRLRADSKTWQSLKTAAEKAAVAA